MFDMPASQLFLCVLAGIAGLLITSLLLYGACRLTSYASRRMLRGAPFQAPKFWECVRIVFVSAFFVGLVFDVFKEALTSVIAVGWVSIAEWGFFVWLVSRGLASEQPQPTNLTYLASLLHAIMIVSFIRLPRFLVGI